MDFNNIESREYVDKIKKEMEGSEELRNKIDIIKKKINPS